MRGKVVVFVVVAAAAVLLGAGADSFIESLSSPPLADPAPRASSGGFDDVYSTPDSYGGSGGYTYSLESYPIVSADDAQDKLRGHPRVYCEQVTGDPSTFNFSKDQTKGLTPGSYDIQFVRLEGRDGLFGCLYGPTGQ